MERQWVRTNSFVAKGKVEVLVIDQKSEFIVILCDNQFSCWNPVSSNL